MPALIDWLIHYAKLGPGSARAAIAYLNPSLLHAVARRGSIYGVNPILCTGNPTSSVTSVILCTHGLGIRIIYDAQTSATIG